MDATVDVVHLTAVMPGYRPIAQFYTDLFNRFRGGSINPQTRL
ncbi:MULTISPECIES: hypothetical protein [unclassified Microcoleus]|nr:MULTISPECIES: hypothetical protein [unclassified Microcoleus]